MKKKHFVLTERKQLNSFRAARWSAQNPGVLLITGFQLVHSVLFVELFFWAKMYQLMREIGPYICALWWQCQCNFCLPVQFDL